MFIYLLESSSASQLQILMLGLAIFGILIILGSIIVFFTNLELRERVQEIRLLGAEMRISVITFFVFVGLLLILPILYTNYISAVSDMSGLQEKNTKLQARMEDILKNQNRTVILYLDLDGVSNENFPKKDDLHVGFSIPGGESNQLKTLNHWVEKYQGHKSVRIQLDDMKSETELSSLEVKNKLTDETWIIEGLKPFFPLVTLKKK